MQTRFESKKRKILELLETPDEQYHDLSPKGSVDVAIRPLIADINRIPGLVTTSSCSGRVSVFCESSEKSSEDGGVSSSGTGGKGKGEWLYVSHSPIDAEPGPELLTLFGWKRMNASPVASSSFIHFKFEPMILHILTASLDDAQRVITAALSAGFRESGAVSLPQSKAGDVTPMVGVRSTGYSFDSIIGYRNADGEHVAMVDEIYLRTLVKLANARFLVNEERIGRFGDALRKQYDERSAGDEITKKQGWEDPEARRRRKREEGLALQRAQAALKAEDSTAEEMNGNTC